MALAASRWPKGSVWLAVFVVASIALLAIFAPARRTAEAKAGLSLTAALPDHVPPGVVLRVGDPQSKWVFQHNGWDKELPFRIEWAEISGGPDVTEAFHAGALDVGLGANVPPIHAVWMGIPVRIVAFRRSADPDRRRGWVFGISPKARITKVADLRGKRIAFSPSQVQGQIVLQTLRAAGIGKKDVTLVELPSNIGGDVYTNSLAAGVVDAAPLSATANIVAQKYLRRYADDGATLLDHPPFRDDAANIYVPETVLNNAAKAAAVRTYVYYWGRSQRWINDHPEEFAQGYWNKQRGLPIADGRLIQQASGKSALPRDWTDAIAYQQAAIDLLAPETGRPRFDAATLFDRRFETVAADGAAAPIATRQGKTP